jgi:FAD/FMN-containing dehydrogenase
MTLIEALQNIVGHDFVRQGDAIPRRNWTDMAGMTPRRPQALVLPGSTQDVSAVLAKCLEARQAIVVQGGMTGLAGGAHPQDGEIAPSLERLQGIEEIDVASRTMTVHAGTPLFKVQDAARDAGLHYGVDLGARGTCTIGGNVATNAGGVQALRYGVTRRNVLGLEVVLSDGTILSGLNKLMKNNTGYDWPQLMIGSEGTLGVITRVCLSLSPSPPALQTALCAVTNVTDAISVLTRLDRALPGRLMTFEGMWRDYMEVTARVTALPQPFRTSPEIILLVEAALGDDEAGRDLFTDTLAALLEDGLILDAVIAQSLQDRQRFWAYREANYEFDRALPGAVHFDVSLPMDRMDDAITQLRRHTADLAPRSTFITYGHMADSNLHLAIYPETFTDDLTEATTAVYDAVGLFEGSVSAEHGIGVLKRSYLSRSRSPGEIRLMKNLKHMFDPAGILNRDRIFAIDRPD